MAFVRFNKRFSRSRQFATYLRRAIATESITETGTVAGTGGTDSAQVEDIVSRTATDSAEVQSIVDSGYIKGVIDATYIQDYIDNTYLATVIDSSYVSARQSGGGGGAGSPTITAVSPTSYDGTSGSSFTITGSNFTVGSVVQFIDANGTTSNASTTTLVSQAELTAVTATNFTSDVDPISVKVTTSGGNVTSSNVITAGSSPSWTTAASLGDFNKDAIVSTTLVATDPDSTGPVTYAVDSGQSLPTGLSLNQSTGVISGTLSYSGITSATTVSTGISALDNGGNRTSRDFTFNILTTAATSVSFTLVHTGNHEGPPTSTMQNWFDANVTNQAGFTSLFYGVGLDLGWNFKGFWVMRPKVDLLVDYTIKGGAGGTNRYHSSDLGRSRHKGRSISGQFIMASYYNNATRTTRQNDLLFWVGQAGGSYINTTYKYASAGGGGCSGIACTSYNNAQTVINASNYVYPIAIAAGGGGLPGAHYPDDQRFAANPLDMPYQVAASGGRYNDVAQWYDNNHNAGGGGGWTSRAVDNDSSNPRNHYGQGIMQNNTSRARGGYGANGYSYGGYNWYRVSGGFGGGGGSAYQRQNNSGSGNVSYNAAGGGGGGGYYGGYPTSRSQTGEQNMITGRQYAYPYGNMAESTTTGNNYYYGAYSYALGLESTGTYTTSSGTLPGTAPSAGVTETSGASSTGGARWTSACDRPTDNGYGDNGNGSIELTFTAA